MEKLTVPAYSIVEVIVSTIIILISALLFASLVNQLVHSYHTSTEVISLFMADPVIDQRVYKGGPYLIEEGALFRGFHFQQTITGDSTSEPQTVRFKLITHSDIFFK